MTTHVQQTLPFPWQGGCQCSLQPWICAPGTHYGWVGCGSVEYEVYPTLPYMANTGNGTPDLLILSPTPYPLDHMLLHNLTDSDSKRKQSTSRPYMYVYEVSHRCNDKDNSCTYCWCEKQVSLRRLQIPVEKS